MFTMAFVPVVIFQSSVSAWYQLFRTEPVGSLLVAVLYLNAAVAALASPFAAYFIGVTKLLSCCFVTATIFLGTHFYPHLEIVSTAYLVMGFTMGLLDNSVTTYMIMLASKLKFVPSEEEETEFQCKLDSTKRESLIRKLFRGVSFAQNLGLIMGGLVTYVVMRVTYTSPKADKDVHATSLESMFETDKDSGRRVCGFETCPRTLKAAIDAANALELRSNASTLLLLSCKTNTLIVGVFLGCCAVGAVVSVFCVHRLRIAYNRGPNDRAKMRKGIETVIETFKDSKLQLITPLLIFIGLEQGFMFADFTKVFAWSVHGLNGFAIWLIQEDKFWNDKGWNKKCTGGSDLKPDLEEENIISFF